MPETIKEGAVAARDPGSVALVAVVGKSPAVVTETLYGLLVAPGVGERFGIQRVSRIEVLTTSTGAALFERHVHDPTLPLHRQDRALAALAREYDLEDRLPSAPDDIRVRVPRTDGSGPIEDVATASASHAFEHLCCAVVRRLKARGWRIHASVAGGRKTMSVHLALAMTLYGQAADAMSHTLVEPVELESDPGFFFPAPLSSSAAPAAAGSPSIAPSVDIVPIPFVRAGTPVFENLKEADTLDESRLPGSTSSYVTDVRQATRRLGTPLVRLRGAWLSVESSCIRLRPGMAALLGGLLHLKARCPERCAGLAPRRDVCPGCFRPVERLVTRGSRFVQVANHLAGRDEHDADWITPERLRSEMSRLKRLLAPMPAWQEVLVPYVIERGGPYGMAVEAALVEDPGAQVWERGR